MQKPTRSPRTRSLWSKWPATTLTALTALTALALVVSTSGDESAVVIDDEEMTDEEAPPEDEPEMESKSESSGSRHRGEEGKMGRPTSKSKSGLYAMKGPKDAVPESAAASPYGGAFAVGSDDADVWGGLTGTEIGEAYGVGGLGLVGTGRGGGGTGDGTIGLGSHGRGGKGGGSYNAEIQSSVLTVGTVDDNADLKAYAKALRDMGEARSGLGIDAPTWDIAPLKQRHATNPGGLDVALVIDTTGSMGDELEYLKVELRDIAKEVSKSFPGVTQRWGLVVYRDHGDQYVTRSVDFRGIESFIEKLGEQEAGGGGDYPEAMDKAMDASAELSWRTGQATARMVFLVADAPTHNGADARRFASSVLEHRSAGTAIYPVGASGVGDDAEAELRLAAKVTGGQYIFLTNHSGVGGDHAAPKVDQYKVETLHAAMTRMIRGELGDPASKTRVAVLEACDETPTPMPMPAVFDASELMPAATPAVSMWHMLVERLAGHLMFALGMAVMVLAGMGFDTLIHRWRTR